jgi:hypothetical protein
MNCHVDAFDEPTGQLDGSHLEETTRENDDMSPGNGPGYVCSGESSDTGGSSSRGGAPHKTLDAQGITGEFLFSLFALFLSGGHTSCLNCLLCLYIVLRLSHGNNYIVVDSAKTTHLVS